jgi:hypothetical protein
VVQSSESGGLVQVVVDTPIPLFGLFSPAHTIRLHVIGHAVAEGR